MKVNYLDWFINKINKKEIKYDLSSSDMKYVHNKDLNLNLKDYDIGESVYIGSERLRKLIAKEYNNNYENVCVTIGASSTMDLVFSSLITKRDEVLVELPCYEPLYKIPLKLGAKVKRFHRTLKNNFQIDLGEIKNLINKKTRLIAFTNLHNPSGKGVNNIKDLIEIAEKNKIYLVSNEVYADSSFKKIEPIANSTDYGITINSLTKSYGLSTLRIGWIIANKNIIGKIKQEMLFKQVVNPGITDEIACYCFENIDLLKQRTNEILKNNFSIVKDFINSREDINCVEPDGGTMCFPKLVNIKNTKRFVDFLIKNYKTLVVPGEFFEMPGFIRIGYGGDTEILKKGLENLSKALDDFK